MNFWNACLQLIPVFAACCKFGVIVLGITKTGKTHFRQINNALKSKKMEEQNRTEEPIKKKTTKDFVILFLAIGGLIIGLLALKYLMGALQIL